jgi:hypothetical protein
MVVTGGDGIAGIRHRSWDLTAYPLDTVAGNLGYFITGKIHANHFTLNCVANNIFHWELHGAGCMCAGRHDTAGAMHRQLIRWGRWSSGRSSQTDDRDGNAAYLLALLHPDRRSTYGGVRGDPSVLKSRALISDPRAWIEYQFT